MIYYISWFIRVILVSQTSLVTLCVWFSSHYGVLHNSTHILSTQSIHKLLSNLACCVILNGVDSLKELVHKSHSLWIRFSTQINFDKLSMLSHLKEFIKIMLVVSTKYSVVLLIVLRAQSSHILIYAKCIYIFSNLACLILSDSLKELVHKSSSSVCLFFTYIK